MLNSKSAKPELTDASEMAAGCRCYLGNSSACYKMGNYRPISMKFGTQTKTDMLSFKNHKSGSVRPFFKMAAAMSKYAE
jgi:hypothetical protein